MQWFDVLDAEIAAHHQKLEEEARAGIEKEKALRKLNGRNA
jgi:hypothetical protein